MKDTNLRKNFIWNTIGSLAVSIISLFYTLILTRYSTLNQTGLYTIAFALACNTVTLASFGGRTYQVTDTKGEISTFSYVFSRYVTVFTTVLILLLYLLSKDYSTYKSLVIILICIFKYLEEISDVYYGILQKNDKLYRVGQFQLFKSVINILVFFIIIYKTNNLLIAFSILVIINLLYFLLLERKSAIKCEKWTWKIDKKDLKKYFNANLFICVLTFLTTYIINSPKYAIDRFLSSDLQAIFGIIIMPATVMLLVGNFILNPIIVMIADKYNNNKIKEIVNLMLKVFGIIIVIGIIGLVACYFLGIPFLNLIYNINLNEYKISLLIVIFGSIFYALTAGMSSILVAMRKIKSQVVANLVVILFSFLICNFLVKEYQILGASITYTVLIIIRFIVYLFILNKAISTKKIRRGD